MAKYFYNAHTRKVVAVFGTLFNEMYVARESEDTLENQRLVPIVYGPQQKYLERIRKRETLTTDHGAISLPIMSFENGAPSYDSSRQKQKLQTFSCKSDAGGITKMFQPTPYIMPMTLSIYSKNNDEALQILEQILPRFAPSLSIKIRPIDGFSGIEDTITFTLDSVSRSDNYEGDYETRRELIYDLNFSVRFYIFGDPAVTNKLIKNTIVSFRDMDTKELIWKETISVNPQSANADDEYTLNITTIEGWESD